MHNHIVIMAGGIGSRFWPLSTPEVPKQFIDILGCGKSLIQLTVERFRGICPDGNIWVVTNEKYVGTVRSQLPGVLPEHILAEPCARNTAPCIAWACSRINAVDPEANVVVTPSDAVVMDTGSFRETICRALDFTAGNEAIVTIGIKPTRPETGYGYIKAGPGNEGTVTKVQEFKEKPTLDIAEQYLREGCYLWNAGIFVWKAATVLKALDRYKPELAGKIAMMTTDAAVQKIFPECEKISIDYAVMEPAAGDGNVYTIPADFGWSDLGNWASLHGKLQHDPDGNGTVGNVSLYGCKNCVVHAEDASQVVLEGLDGYIVAIKGGRILVCRRSEEQRIREFAK